MNSITFDDIKEIALAEFWLWEGGETFIWLLNEWPKFEPHISDKGMAESLIKGLSKLYSEFCLEGYGAGIDNTIEYVDNQYILDSDCETAVAILVEAYDNLHDVHREFMRIAFEFNLPHMDGTIFLETIFKARFEEKHSKNCPFGFLDGPEIRLTNLPL